MIITNVRRGVGRPVLAWFDVELEPGVRIYDISMRRNNEGNLRIFAPSAGDRRVVTFAPEFADEIISAAEAELEGLKPYGHSYAY